MSAPAPTAKGVIRLTGTFPNLIVKDHGGYQSRHARTLQMMRDVFTNHAAAFHNRSFDVFIGSFDNPESCNDLAAVVPHVLTYSITDQCRPNIHVIPDFIFGGWPEAGIQSYDETTQAISIAGRMLPRHDKLFWIGNAGMHDDRMKLVELALHHPDVMSCVAMQWQPHKGASTGLLKADNYVSLPDHAAYSMLLDIRGAGYSGRLKLLMHAARPVFLVERPFREFFYEHLRPFEHFIPVKSDLSDLVQRIQQVKGNANLAQTLGANAAAFAAKYLTRDYALNYLKDVLLKVSHEK